MAVKKPAAKKPAAKPQVDAPVEPEAEVPVGVSPRDRRHAPR